MYKHKFAFNVDTDGQSTNIPISIQIDLYASYIEQNKRRLSLTTIKYNVEQII